MSGKQVIKTYRNRFLKTAKMRRYTKCPKCGAPTDFCLSGHSLCMECGWQTEHCDYPKEEIIKRFFETCSNAIEDGDVRYIFDFEYFVRNCIDTIKNIK